MDKSLYHIKKVNDFRKKVFEESLEQNKKPLWHQASLQDVRKVIILLSASRSGSSLLFSLLRKVPELYSLSGESVPFFKLRWPFSQEYPSDAFSGAIEQQKGVDPELTRDFLSDFSLQEDPGVIMHEADVLEEYIQDLLLRLPLQWHEVDFSRESLERVIRKAFLVYRENQERFSEEDFYLELLFLLREEYKAINPYYYDIPVAKVRNKFPKLSIPFSPPCITTPIEEPPFIVLSPRRKLKASDLLEKFLLLKTPADCYRLPFLEALLPHAQFTFIYLTRNPLASINGLYDGWLHRGFFSHNLQPYLTSQKNAPCGSLNISGYSDICTWGRWWWKYDLPPDWQEYAQSSLEEVCAFQWKSAHTYIQDYLHSRKKPFLLVSYEEFMKTRESRAHVLRKILDFVGLDSGALKNIDLHNLPHIQVTRTPQSYRWKNRGKLLEPFLQDKEINRIASSLGYTYSTREEWS